MWGSMAISQGRSDATSRAMLVCAGGTQTPLRGLNMERMNLFNI